MLPFAAVCSRFLTRLLKDITQMVKSSLCSSGSNFALFSFGIILLILSSVAPERHHGMRVLSHLQAALSELCSKKVQVCYCPLVVIFLWLNPEICPRILLNV